MLKSVLADLYKSWRQTRAQRPRTEPAPRQAQRDFAPSWRAFGAKTLQERFDVAVVLPTILRTSVLDAVGSVFAQSRDLRIQLLIGVDAVSQSDDALVNLLRKTPRNVASFLFYPGYSTSVRHGGVHEAKDGGSLRTVLTYLANARRIAYLDDDNWWHADHLRALFDASNGKDWAYSLRWFVHPVTRRAICQDAWESLGPGEGLYAQKFGGWVDPNCLMIDKIACEGAIRWWCIPLWGDQKGMSADRRVYDFLQRHGEPGRTNLPTVYYTLQPDDAMHPQRVALMNGAYEMAEKLSGQAAS